MQSFLLNDNVFEDIGEMDGSKTDYSQLSEFKITNAPDEFFFWVSPKLWGTTPFSLPSYEKANGYEYFFNDGDVFRVSRIANTPGEVGIWYEIGQNVWVPVGGPDNADRVQLQMEYEELPQTLVSEYTIANWADAVFTPKNYEYTVTASNYTPLVMTEFNSLYRGNKPINDGDIYNVVEVRYDDSGSVWYKTSDNKWLLELGYTLGTVQKWNNELMNLSMGIDVFDDVINTLDNFTSTISQVNSIVEQITNNVSKLNSVMEKLNTTVGQIEITVNNLNVSMNNTNAAVSQILSGIKKSIQGINEVNDGVAETVNAVDQMNTGLDAAVSGVTISNLAISKINSGISNVNLNLSSVLTAVDFTREQIDEAMKAQKEWASLILAMYDVDVFETTGLRASDSTYNASTDKVMSKLNLDLSEKQYSRYVTASEVNATTNADALSRFGKLVGATVIFGKGVFDVITGFSGIVIGSTSDVAFSLASGGALVIPGTALTVAIDSASVAAIASGAAEISSAYAGLQMSKGYSDGGTYKSSQTIGGRPINVTDSGRKRSLRVDYEPMSNKIQVQDQNDKSFDYRIDYTKITDDESILNSLPKNIAKNKSVATEIVKRVRKAIYYIENK